MNVAGRGGGGAPVPWRALLAAIALGAGAYLLWLFVLATQREITWLVVAGFFAVVLSPLVDFLVRRAHLRRTLAALIVFVVGFASVGGLLYVLIRPIVDQVNKLVNDFPHLVQDAQSGKGPIGHLVKRYDLVHKAQQYAPKVRKYLSSSGSKALSILRKIGDTVVSALTILVLTFLLLVEGPKVLDGITSLASPAMQERLKRMGHNASRAISGYMLGNVIISVIASGVTYVGLWAFGVPFREVAAVWVGFADLIPLVGATLGAIPTVALAFLHSVPAGIGMIILYVVYQQFENHVIQVAIMSRTVKLSPLGVLVSLLIGVQLFGLLGALLAIPAAGILHVVGVELYRERQARQARSAEVAPGAGKGSNGGAPPDPGNGAGSGVDGVSGAGSGVDGVSGAGSGDDGVSGAGSGDDGVSGAGSGVDGVSGAGSGAGNGAPSVPAAPSKGAGRVAIGARPGSRVTVPASRAAAPADGL